MSKAPNTNAERRLKTLLWVLGLLPILGAALFARSGFLAKNTGGLTAWCVFGILLMVAIVPYVRLLVTDEKTAKLTQIYHGPLAGRVAAIGMACDCATDQLFVVESQGEVQKLSVVLYRRKVFITRRAINELSDAALDFGIASELSETGVNLNLVCGLASAAGVGLAFGFLKWAPSYRLPAYGPVLISALLLAFVAATSALIAWVNRFESRRQIKRAFRVVPSRAAAREWFEKSIHGPDYAATAKRLSAALDDLERAAAGRFA